MVAGHTVCSAVQSPAPTKAAIVLDRFYTFHTPPQQWSVLYHSPTLTISSDLDLPVNYGAF